MRIPLYRNEIHLKASTLQRNILHDETEEERRTSGARLIDARDGSSHM